MIATVSAEQAAAAATQGSAAASPRHVRTAMEPPVARGASRKTERNTPLRIALFTARYVRT